jgi:hypothetical protein
MTGLGHASTLPPLPEAGDDRIDQIVAELGMAHRAYRDGVRPQVVLAPEDSAPAPEFSPEALRDVLLQALADLLEIHPGLDVVEVSCMRQRVDAMDWALAREFHRDLRCIVNGARAILCSVDAEAVARLNQWMMDLPFIPFDFARRRAT